jgi:hypothetical protein
LLIGPAAGATADFFDEIVEGHQAV